MGTDFISTGFTFAVLVLLFILVYWIFNFIILYHLTRFGIGTQPKKFAAVFLLGSIILFFISASFFAGLDTDALGQKIKELAGSNFNITYPK
jgi:hypothetical protein